VNTEQLQKYLDLGVEIGIKFGTHLLGAIALWVVGRMVARAVVSQVEKACQRRKVDPTLILYLTRALAVTLNIVIGIAILGVFGIETTSFAGILAAMGVAIGMAWSGLLSNLAAGIFMIVLRPFKVGDAVTVAGITGSVRAIGLFATELNTPDNVHTTIGNARVFGDTIQNYSANAYRRVDLTAQLSGAANHQAAINKLRIGLSQIEHVLKDPSPVVEIVDANLAGPVLAVRPFTHNDHYWSVYFATNQLIREALAEFPAPVNAVQVIEKK
jgi:small conductance mechanosensitive channel